MAQTNHPKRSSLVNHPATAPEPCLSPAPLSSSIAWRVAVGSAVAAAITSGLVALMMSLANHSLNRELGGFYQLPFVLNTSR
jgi:hypothetical protein